jgi:hypothetical protein
MKPFTKANFNGLPLASLPDFCPELVAKKKKTLINVDTRDRIYNTSFSS